MRESLHAALLRLRPTGGNAETGANDVAEFRTIDRDAVRTPLHLAGVGFCALAAALAIVRHGYREPPLALLVSLGLEVGLLAAAFAIVAWRVRYDPERRFGYLNTAALAVAIAGLALFGVGLAPWLLLFEAGIGVLLATELWQLNAHLSRRLANPSVLFPASFVLLIAIGTLLIRLPAATPPDDPIGWVDALFTMTSAVCVTGLTVRETATQFTPVGHLIIAIFIQLGGLGIIIFGSTLALLLGERLSMRENVTLSRALSEYPAHRITSFVRFIVGTTLVIELIGAAALLAMWPGEMPLPRRVGWSVFHSISAFCNAGFDITCASMEPFQRHPLAHGVIAPLIVLGGIGFLVLQDLGRQAEAVARALWRRMLRRGRHGRRPWPRLSLQSKIVLFTSLLLYLGGLGAIFVSEASQWRVADAHEAAGLAADASFMSLTARTAGFNSVPMEDLAPGSRFALMVLMFVGGSPGSTAGGVKTAVVALLALTVLATLKQRAETEAFGRAIPDQHVKRAGTIAFAFMCLIGAAVLMLSLTEGFRFELILFEAVSASTTTGLSLGITPDLTPGGKLVLVCAMFLGRVGPLTLFASLLEGRRPARYSYPHEEVSLG